MEELSRLLFEPRQGRQSLSLNYKTRIKFHSVFLEQRHHRFLSPWIGRDRVGICRPSRGSTLLAPVHFSHGPEALERILERAKAFHAKAQSSKGAKETKQLLFAVFAPWRLGVRLFDFFTPSLAMGHILPPLRGLPSLDSS
jgi:hypothetical protein